MASVPNRDPLGNLVGGGASRLGVSGAMRARDVARPSEDDLAEAAANLVIRHAAPRVDTKPLPQGIAPAELPDARLQEHATQPNRGRKRGGPRPAPPHHG